MPPLRIAFLGSDSIALPLLDWLAGDGAACAQIAAVYTQPDRPVGRGQKVTPNAIKQWALARSLPVHQPDKLTPDVTAEFASAAYDLAVVMAYGHILRDDFIGAPRLGTVNLHASLLPRYRGASPIQSAIAAGERETGVTLMRIVRRLDAGPVAGQERVAIEPGETAADIERKLAGGCVPLLQRTLPGIADGSLVFTPQDDAQASYCRKLDKTDGALDFGAPAPVLAARINGLFPWPGCGVEVGGVRVKFGRARAEPAGTNSAAPGTVLAPTAGGLGIATSSGVLRVLELQRPGGRMLPAAEYLRGHPIAVGTVLPSVPMPALVAPVPFRK
jgi:methionyl-tRNA formyltransferase